MNEHDWLVQANEHWLKEELRALRDKQEEINITLVRNTESLEHHIKRTDMLEAQLQPVKSHVDFINKAAKAVIVTLGALEALKKLGLF